MKNLFVIPIIILALLFGSGCHKKPVIVLDGEHVCVSLRQLLLQADEIIKSGRQLPKEFTTLGGMSFPEGYVVDKNNSDIILVGRNVNGRAGMQIQDLLDQLDNVFSDSAYPLCSLDPLPENIARLNALHSDKDFFNLNDNEKLSRTAEALGGQQTVVGGVGRNTVTAATMIYADYHMKKVSQGLVKLDSVRSCIDIHEDRLRAGKTDDDQGAQSAMSRFWFHIENRGKTRYPTFLEGKSSVFIGDCPVVLLTEKQMSDSDGKLKDAGAKDPVSLKFADEMSEHFKYLTSKVPLYAQLENSFRLQALFRAMELKMRGDNITDGIVKLASRITYSNSDSLPPALPPQVNCKTVSLRGTKDGGAVIRKMFFLVCGGVSMKTPVEKSSIYYGEKVYQFQNKVLDSRPDSKMVTWKVKQ